MNIVGNIYNYENEKYKVIAQKGMDIIAVENITYNSNFKGDIEFLYDAVVIGDTIKCLKAQYFGTNKTDMYAKIEQKIKGGTKKHWFKKEIIKPINVNDTEGLVNALNEDYRKTPAELLRLIVTAYQNNM